MARKKKVQVETPPSTAPEHWEAILAKHWQSQSGKWAAPQHYNCTYMAMFPPELPHYFIKRFTKLGDTVLDPFSGRGTTAVEASAQGRIGIGNDLNPLAVALSRGKISNPRLEPVLARLKELEAGYEAKKWIISKEPDKIKMIYHPNTLSQLCYLKGNLDWSKQGVDAFLVSVLMGAMHGSSSGFLSVSMPNTFSMGWNYVKKYIKEKNLECPDRDVFEVLEKRVKRYLKKGYLVGSGKIIEGDVRDLDSKVEHNSVQLLFTSPPYLKVIKYGLYNWIRLWFLTESGSHEEVDAKLDDTHALNEYLEFMKDTLTATLPLLDRKRGLSCWAIGDVKGLNLAWAVWHHAGSKIEVKADDGTVLKYKLIAILEDKIPDNQKVSKIWKTLAHHVDYVNETDEVVESVGQWDTEKEAKAAMKNAEEKEGLTLKIRVEKTNDKSGKATPTDRILIIAPESSNPEAFMKAQDLDWKPFHTTKSVIVDDLRRRETKVTSLPGIGMSHEEWIADFNKCLDTWDGKYIITSPDVDGILSACLLADKYGAKLAGIYTTRYLILFDGYGAKEAKNALWLDHDISEEGVQCMGQHLVDHSELDTLSKRGKNSFNPNNYYGQTWKKSFHGSSMKAGKRDKYPYATIHFLMAGMGVECPPKYSKHFHLLAHADGSWATCVDYKVNTLTWKDTMFGNTQSLVNVLTDDYVFDDRNFQGHQELVTELIDLGVAKRGSRSGSSSLIPSDWQDFQGKQSISYRKNSPPQEWLAKFNGIVKYVSDKTNWQLPLPQKVTSMDRGLVLELSNRGEVKDGNFDQFMYDENIFSHAITGAGTMRFTKGLRITDDEIISFENILIQPIL